ncbi:MAG TPA: hypothetical protein VJG90_00325 [Candidatus Nanoarchaeia archaeon]|nr:hypothetical protein [Candidatus Nanoarchaeia archaeon]
MKEKWSRRKEDLNSSVWSLWARMMDFFGAKNIKMLLLVMVGYMWWLVLTSSCFNSLSCFGQVNSWVGWMFLIALTWWGNTLLKQLTASDEKEEKLRDLSIKKMELEIADLKKNQSARGKSDKS